MSSVRLEQLELHSFRNLEALKLSFHASLNLFYGDNAQGKTNLLEAIYLLCALRPFRAGKNLELIRWAEQEASVRGTILALNGKRDVEVRLREGGRRVLVDGKTLKNVGDFASNVRVILFCPDDLSLIRGAPTLRRTYLDRAICHLYPRYAEVIRDYAQVIQQKNRLLSQGTTGPLLEAWEERQIELGSHMLVTRSRFVRRLTPLVEETFEEISGTELKAGAVYQLSEPGFADLEGVELRRRYAQAIETHREEELRRGVTVVGPHRDDLLMTLDGREAATWCSQGQTRMLSLCLKIVELKVLLEERGVVPIFLLDDVSSELDEHRNRYLMTYLARVGCQIFLTTTALRHVPTEAFEAVSTFRVSAGNVLPDPFDKS